MHDIAQRMLEAGQTCKACRKPATRFTFERGGAMWWYWFWCAACFPRAP
jgi:hypothetical protein